MSTKDVSTPRGSQKQPGDKDFEEFTDLLRCYICMDKLKNACMCPHCTQTSCYICIKRWVTSHKAECPHCRAKLVESDLIKVPLVQELSDFIMAKESHHTKTASKTELCAHHPQEQLTVYCETCNVCVCTNCALWGQHRQDQGHSIKPLEDLYKKHSQHIKDDLARLKEYMKEIVPLMETVNITMEGVKTQNTKVKDDLNSAVGDIYSRLEDQMREKLQRLQEFRKRLKKQAFEISSVCTDLESRMSGSKSAFINDRDELGSRLERVLNDVERRVSNNTVTLPQIDPYVNEIIPPYETSQYEIKNFSVLREKGDEIYSNPLNFCGLSWRLKVYPNGTAQFTGKYLGVFIELSAGYSQTVPYHYCVEMVHGSGTYKQSGNSFTTSRNFKREYSSNYAVGESWGYKKFYDISKLESEGFLVQDILLLRFSVRHPNYHQKCRDYGMYVNDLKHKIMSLKHQNTQLQQKCEGIYVENKDISEAVSTPSPNSQPVSSPPDVNPTHQAKDPTTGAGSESVQMSIERPHPSGGVRGSQSSAGAPILSQPASSYGREHYHTRENRRHYPSASHSVLTQQQHRSYQNSLGRPRKGERHMMYTDPYMSHPHRNSDNMDGRRQSYERMMYEQSQQHSPRKLMHGPTSLSQMDFVQYGSVHQSMEHLDWPSMPPQPHSTSRQPPYIPIGGPFPDIGISSQTEGLSNEDPLSGETLMGGSNSQVHIQSQLSQEPIEHLQQTSEILSMNTLTTDDPFTQRMLPSGLDVPQEEVHHYHQQPHPRHLRNKPPPPSNKLGGKARMSLSDLSALPPAGNSQSLNEMGYLSQSVQGLQEHQQLPQQSPPSRQNKPVRSKSLHRSHEHLNKMRSNPDTFHGPPGLISSVSARLTAPISSVTPGNNNRQPARQQRHQKPPPQQPQQQDSGTSSTAESNTSSKTGNGTSPQQTKTLSSSSLTQPESGTSRSGVRRGSSDATNSSPEGSTVSLTQTSEPRLQKSGSRRSYTNLKKRPSIQMSTTEEKTQRLSAGGKTTSNTSLNDIL